MTTVLVDLDGTLADTAHRAHLLNKKPRDWSAYSKACGDDSPIDAVISAVKGLHEEDWRVVIVTGRTQDSMAETEHWLKYHGVPFDNIFMRPSGDTRKNPDFKRSVAEKLLKDGFTIGLAIEDHPGVAAVYAELGIPTLVVARPGADQGILTELSEAAASQGVASNLPAPIAEALSLARDTFARKNADYAQDSSWRSNFDAIGNQMGFDAMTACDALIAVKQARLQSLAINGRDPANESLFDTILDRMVYSIISVGLALDELEKSS
jgi:hypothetical protein